MNRHKSILLPSAAAMFCLATAVQAQGVRWAGECNPPWSGRVNILHAPDFQITPLAPPLTLNHFGLAMRYPGLRELLGVSAEDFARADIIAFEVNGWGGGAGVEGGWESAVITFTDGTNTYVANFDETVGSSSDPTIVANGTIVGPDGPYGPYAGGGSAYAEFFGLCSTDIGNHSLVYILFDLDAIKPAIDTSSPYFTMTLENNWHPGQAPGVGSPDVDAVGILTNCSE